jgi:NitT/TauT family transport system substrate-binding protein
MDHFGITDYKISYLGGVPDDVAAVLSGAAQATCSNPPGSYQLDKAGDHILYNLATAKLKVAQTGIATTTDEIQNHPDVVQRFLTGLTEAQKIMHDSSAANLPLLQSELAKASGTSQTADDTTKAMEWERTVQTGNLTPYTDDLTIPQKYQAESNKAVANIDLSSFVVDSFAKDAAAAVYGTTPPANN